jgi:hypothetical protein
MAVENAPRERFGYDRNEDGRISFGERVRDMFDGGGRGQSGPRFEGGGLLSDIGNALGGPGGRARGQGFGYTDAAGNVVSPGIDMINGGGRGRAGSQFEGGLLSAVLNSLGVRPYGYVDPEEAVTAGMDETAPSLMASPAAPTRPTMRPPQLNTAPVNSAHTLTQQDIELLQKIGLAFNAMPGEPATQQEIDALGRYPTPMGAPMSAQPGFLSPPASTTATTDPRLLPIPTPDIADLEAYLSGQPAAMATSPMLSVPARSGSPIRPMSDLPVLRPYVSRSTGRIPPMQGFLPVKTDIRPPPPAPPGMNLPVNPGAAEANRAYIEMLRRAAASGNPIRPAASILPR